MRHDLALAALLACGCGAGRSTGPTETASAVAVPSPDPAPARVHPSAGGPGLTRSAVRAAVSRGLGAFLQNVELDDRPVFVGGKFHGFRIAALRDPAFWGGVDLKPGDVVTAVNGMPIERPEQALAAFDSLRTAHELRVSYERDGQGRELVYPIVEDRAAGTSSPDEPPTE